MRKYTGLGGSTGIKIEDGEQIDLYDAHPTPWRVEYKPMFTTWHPKSSPCIVDRDGVHVLKPFQYVGHPGSYDTLADQICHMIAEKANASNLY